MSGESNGKVARALRLSEATVKSYLLTVYGKLGVNDRTAAATEAIRRGYSRAI